MVTLITAIHSPFIYLFTVCLSNRRFIEATIQSFASVCQSHLPYPSDCLSVNMSLSH